jgi:hypothetical protein
MEIYFFNHWLGLNHRFPSLEVAAPHVKEHYENLLQHRTDNTGDAQWQEEISKSIECWEADIRTNYGSLDALYSFA